MVNWLEGIILAGFSLFFIIAPYEVKYSGKVFFVVGLIGLLIIMFLKYKYRFYRSFFKINTLNKPFFFFGVCCFFSIVFSLNRYHSQSIFFDRYLVYFVFFLCGLYLAGISRLKFYIIIYVFCFSGVLFAIGGLWDFLSVNRMNPALAERLWSVFGRRIPYYGFPLYLTFFAPFIFSAFLFIRSKVLGVLTFFVSILLLLCLTLNVSRAAWLSVFLGLLFVIVLRWKKLSPIKILIFFVAISFILFIPVRGERIKTILEPSKWSNRLPLYKTALLIAADNPIFGSGIGMFEKMLHSKKYELPKDYPVSTELNLHAHNTYLEVAAEMGLLGILSFLGIFITFFWKAIKKIRSPGNMSKNTQVIFIGLTATVFAALVFAFSTTYITVGVNNSCYFWLLFGMAAGMLNREDKLKVKAEKAGTVP